MASRRVNGESSKPRRPPATTPDAQESQLIALAIDCAEQQMRDGTATSQLITHFLKLGSSRERLEQERLQLENQFLDAKREALASQKRVEEMYADALNAMRSYSGQDPVEETFDD